MANDYRYFPEPDLMPLVLTEEYISRIKQSMPVLPEELYHIYTEQLGLSDYDATVLTSDREISSYFEQVRQVTHNYKAAANWLMGPIKSYINEHHQSVSELKLTPKTLAQLIALVDSGKVNNTVANHKLFPALLKESGKSPEQLAIELNLLINDDNDELEQFIIEALNKFPDKVKEYKKGKKGVLGLFMGEIMKRSKGKIDPQKTNQLLVKALEK
jgi:aspartyl-tRNA(Asn)/glutamyl-tRNA(Gln) amidotransferase subunit B